MATYYKPQSPIQSGEDFIYPITTADQVILSDGSRLEKNGQISIGGGTVKTVSGVAPDSTGNVALTAEDVGALSVHGTAENAGKLGGKTLAEIMLTLYPVGAVYISVNSTSPASLFGGTWEQLKDRFLLGAGDSYAAGSTGGEAEHTLTKLEMPTHYHNAYYLGLGGSSTTPAYYATLNKDSYTYNYENTTPNTDTVATTTREGSGVAHNNMPPYIAVYIWKRVS